MSWRNWLMIALATSTCNSMTEAAVVPLNSSLQVFARAGANDSTIDARSDGDQQGPTTNDLHASTSAEAADALGNSSRVEVEANANWTNATAGQVNFDLSWFTDAQNTDLSASSVTAPGGWQYEFQTDLPGILTLNYSISTDDRGTTDSGFEGFRTVPQAVLPANSTGTVKYQFIAGPNSFRIFPVAAVSGGLLAVENVPFVDASMFGSFNWSITTYAHPTWIVDANGDWSTNSNWIGGQPNGVGTTAEFGSVITSPRTVTLNVNRTVGHLIFDNPNAYRILGSGLITLSAPGSASIEVLDGSHRIDARLSLGSNHPVIRSGPGTLTIAGFQRHAVGAVLALNEGTTNFVTDCNGALAIDANAAANFSVTQHLAALNIGDGGTVTLARGGQMVLVTNALTMNGTGSLDLNDSGLVVKSSAANRMAVLSAITQYTAAGANELAWDGPGIRSALAAADGAQLRAVGVILNDNGLGSPLYPQFFGETIDANSIIGKLTLYGDANLDGAVDGTDYALIDNGFNAGLTGWFNGDFDYKNGVDGTDYALIDNSFNSTAGMVAFGSLHAVPEPGSLTLLAIGLATLAALKHTRLRRRR